MKDCLNKVEIFTDGACSGNPGPGGYGVVLKYGNFIKELSGGISLTTNNRMELTAVIVGLKALKKPLDVIITTDSKYIVDAVNKKWVFNWQANNWIKSDKSKALNIDLWLELLGLLKIHNVEFRWIKGHSGHKQNERCDQLAVAEIKKYKKI